MISSRRSRRELTRAIAAAAPGFGLGAVAHTWAGGSWPGLGWLAASASILLAATWSVRQSLLRIPTAIVGLAGCQGILHATLVLGSQAGSPLHHASGHHHALTAGRGNAVMLAAHASCLVATLLVLLVLEPVIDIAGRWLDDRTGAAATAVASPRLRWAISPCPLGLDSSRLLSQAPRRGPPTALLPLP